MRIVLTGNPNCGKTTMYNAVTGKSESVGNYSGITVDKKEAPLKNKFNKNNEKVTIVDLPGAYSITSFTKEEALTRDYILDSDADVIVNIVDGANISRSLFFTTQLLELGVPVVIAINKEDVVSKRGDVINIEKLSKTLNCKIVYTNASNEKGLQQLFEYAIQICKESGKVTPLHIENGDKDLERQKFIDNIVKETIVKKTLSYEVSKSDKVDEIVAHKWLGIPIFLGVMYVVFWFSQVLIGGAISEYFNETLFGEIIPGATETFLTTIGVNDYLKSLIIDGIIAGFGAVIGFLPLIMVLFFCLGLLEDSGYLSRVAVVMDRFFKKIGLSGKSIIPMIVGTGCSVPGIMATRTIENEKERKITAILTPFVPCGAKLPIIALFAGVFFKDQAWVGPSMYVLAILMIAVCGLFLNKVLKFKVSDESRFIIELPEYKVPSVKYAFNQMMEKGKAFVINASTIIVAMNALVWFLSNHGFNLKVVEDTNNSMLAFVGGFVSIFLIPLGLKGWQLGAATITGFVAKEEVVATLAVVLASTEEGLLTALPEYFTPTTALAFIVFNLFIPPCFAAIGAMNAELGSKKMLFKAIGFQTIVGYVAAMLVSQIGAIITTGQLGEGFLVSVIIIIAVIFLAVNTLKKYNS